MRLGIGSRWSKMSAWATVSNLWLGDLGGTIYGQAVRDHCYHDGKFVTRTLCTVTATKLKLRVRRYTFYVHLCIFHCSFHSMQVPHLRLKTFPSPKPSEMDVLYQGGRSLKLAKQLPARACFHGFQLWHCLFQMGSTSSLRDVFLTLSAHRGKATND